MLVSVIIPAFNAGRFLRETLNSAVSQTHRDIEIVVVDDGSTDNTVDIVGEFQRQDPRIILLRQPNQGVSTARNFGIKSSKGKLIAFLDADDLWHPTKIKKQHDLLASVPEDVGLVYVYSRMIDVKGYIEGYTGACVSKRGHVFHDLLIDNFIGNGSTAMVRRSCLSMPEPFDVEQKGNEDIYFYMNIAAKYKVDVVPEFLVGYRWNTGQNKSSNLERQIASYKSMMEKMRRKFPGIPPRILRWSESGFYLSYAQTLFKKGQYKRSLKIFVTKVLVTPSYFLSPLFRRLMILGFKWSYRKIFRVKQEKRHYFAS